MEGCPQIDLLLEGGTDGGVVLLCCLGLDLCLVLMPLVVIQPLNARQVNMHSVPWVAPPDPFIHPTCRSPSCSTLPMCSTSCGATSCLIRGPWTSSRGHCSPGPSTWGACRWPRCRQPRRSCSGAGGGRTCEPSKPTLSGRFWTGSSYTALLGSVSVGRRRRRRGKLILAAGTRSKPIIDLMYLYFALITRCLKLDGITC